MNDQLETQRSVQLLLYSSVDSRSIWRMENREPEITTRPISTSHRSLSEGLISVISIIPDGTMKKSTSLNSQLLYHPDPGHKVLKVLGCLFLQFSQPICWCLKVSSRKSKGKKSRTVRFDVIEVEMESHSQEWRYQKESSSSCWKIFYTTTFIIIILAAYIVLLVILSGSSAENLKMDVPRSILSNW